MTGSNRGRVGSLGRGTVAFALCSAVLLGPAAASAGVPFQIGKPKLNTRKGTATLAVTVPAEGKVSVSRAKRLSYTEVFFDGPGSAKLPIRARKGKPVRLLKARGRLKAKFPVTYVPQGPGQPPGGPTSKVLTVTLKLKAKPKR